MSLNWQKKEEKKPKHEDNDWGISVVETSRFNCAKSQFTFCSDDLEISSNTAPIGTKYEFEKSAPLQVQGTLPLS